MAEKIHRVDNEKASWEVPNRGVINGLPVHRLPPDALFDGLNICLRDGHLQARPGMSTFAATALTGKPTGAISSAITGSGAFQDDAFQNDAFQVAASIPVTLAIVGTSKKLYAYYNGIFNDITGTLPIGTDLGGSADNPARFTTLTFGTPPTLHTIHTNGVDTPRYWKLGDPTFMTMTGSPPVWKDVTTISDRIIGLVGAYEIVWGEALSLTSWPILNSRSLADTADQTVGITNFGVSGGAVYKSNSIWNVVVTGEADSTKYFRFDFKIQIEGPASAPALVNAQGAHFYMTKTGRIGRWDGYNHEWIADGVWPLIRANLDSSYAGRIHGVYQPTHDELWFWYPRIGDAGECKGLVIVAMPRPQNGLAGYAAFPGLMTYPVSAAASLIFDLKEIMAFTSDAASVGAKSHLMNGAVDVAEPFDGFWQTGFATVPGPNPARFSDAEAFCERGEAYGKLTFRAVSSHILDTPGGTVSNIGSTIDLATVKVFDLKASNARGRYIGGRLEFTTPVTIRYEGLEIRVIDRDK